jgi:hypothetical protein
MGLIERLESIKQKFGLVNSFPNEQSISQAVVLPVLSELGWDVFDASKVCPEYNVDNKRVDFALLDRPNKPAVFIEVKKLGNCSGADEQLFAYAFREGVPMAILTDGQEWSFYLPAERGDYEERRVYKLDILERNVKESAERFERYLSFEGIHSGSCLEAAKADHKNTSLRREADAALPKAWEAILNDSDSLILELLAEKAEDICGFKPSKEKCKEFIGSIAGGFTPAAQTFSVAKVNRTQKRRADKVKLLVNKEFRSEKYSLSYGKKTYYFRTKIDVLAKLLELLGNDYKGFYDKFAGLEHGRTRRYLDRDKYALYPGRPDLADESSRQVGDNWWMGTNYCTSDIAKILNLAIKTAGRKAEASIKYDLG